ncbi:MAG TPA: DUF5655 domain-containing protein, partial [Jiangellales bacterium]|nr:DUF5655 domain-containing protein [Jiangellales bacterium]
TPEEFFAGHPAAYQVFTAVRDLVLAAGPAEVRVSRSQVAFRRRRGFAYLWLPGTWLHRPTAEVVLSVALPRHDTSARFKEVAHPSPRIWMHHLEVHDPTALDAEVAGWLAEAAAAAG